jgi:hypothetical protein
LSLRVVGSGPIANEICFEGFARGGGDRSAAPKKRVNNPRALERVAEWGDGWLPVVQSV